MNRVKMNRELSASSVIAAFNFQTIAAAPMSNEMTAASLSQDGDEVLDVVEVDEESYLAIVE
jgi:hypothetical protein